jgi:hypothetical protein
MASAQRGDEHRKLRLARNSYGICPAQSPTQHCNATHCHIRQRQQLRRLLTAQRKATHTRLSLTTTTTTMTHTTTPHDAIER